MNWDEWSFQITLFAKHQGFSRYLDGTLSQLPKDTYAKAYCIWAFNDLFLKYFLYECISCQDYCPISLLPMSHAMYEKLYKTYKKQELHAQMVLIKQAMDLHAKCDTLLLKMANESDAYGHRSLIWVRLILINFTSSSFSYFSPGNMTWFNCNLWAWPTICPSLWQPFSTALPKKMVYLATMMTYIQMQHLHSLLNLKESLISPAPIANELVT